MHDQGLDGARPGAGAVTIVANDVGPVGGMERVLSELILGLRKGGRDVTVIARTCELPPGSGVRFHRVRGPARPFLLAYPWFLVLGTLALSRYRRGIVQITGAVVLARADVVSVHYCHQVGPATPSRATALFRVNVRVANVVKRLSERVVFWLNRAAAFVCVSNGVADEVRRHYPALAGRVLTIHNGVDTDAFAPGLYRAQAERMRDELGIARELPIAAFVGSEWERKGLRAAIGALASAPEWTLLVAGRGDRASHERLADSLGVAPRVRWLGVRTDVGAVYELADAFVLPTSYETFSLVTFEAAASGVPLLVTRVSGVGELLQDGVNGFYITSEPHEIARRLRELAADPALRSRMGAQARRSALRFSWNAMVHAHEELYDRLAGGGASGARMVALRGGTPDTI